jgi:glycosyltransferase involved in cell wall biosynthesis
VVSHLNPIYGGIAASMRSFCEATEQQGISSPLVGFCAPSELEQAQPPSFPSPMCLPAGRIRWMVDTRLRRELMNLIRSNEGVHIHGIWESHCAVASSMAQSNRTPYIISAHGMLERWALQHKRFKKALYATMVEVNNLRRATCLRALTADEAHDYRRIGLSTPLAIVPGAVELPKCVDRELFPNAFPDLINKRIVIFLGRLHPKKGLDLLIRAWANTGNSVRDAHLVIAGPDTDGMRMTLERLTSDLGVASSVTFAGMMNASMKWSALANSSLFVLPSFSEGFSVAVLEAMGAGLPVVVTDACHFPEIAQKDCGWVIEPSQKALEDALSEYFQCRMWEGEAMGNRGRKLVESKFTWNVVGDQMARVYEWANGGRRPDNLETI